ncbi:MAG: hypothetical protein GY845_29630 [Planctomycetes bacterium]|nr:hypothetical protein [Planctomycetota bacterium]
MSEKRDKVNRGIYKKNSFSRVFTILVIIIMTIFVLVSLILISLPPAGRPDWIVCATNISGLGKAIYLYRSDYDGQYPTSDNWCDLLVMNYEVRLESLVCKGSDAKIGESSYALNKNIAGKKSSKISEDTVVLFETNYGKNPLGRDGTLGDREWYKSINSLSERDDLKQLKRSEKVYKLRWNQVGGSELLASENHKSKVYSFLFNDGHVESVKAERLGKLNWGTENEEGVEKNIEYSKNFRRPTNEKELRYWLKNMFVYHRFNNKEIYSATGLTNDDIKPGLKISVRYDKIPGLNDDKLLVLPYPGGRHPRIGFLEGAIDPQRETKFSVFTPWDENSYVVVDLPEAIWSNLGLTYLAHTHIDTIWTKQGIELKKLEWNRNSDGSLDIERELPNGIAFGVKVKPTKKAVLMEMWLKNGTNNKLTDLRVQICVMTKMAAGFEQQTNDNKVITNPYVACTDSDGKRWIITAMEGCHNPWGNANCPCFHSDPKFPDLEPGEIKRLRGWLSFYEGIDVKAEFKRIEETGWRNQ